MLLSAARTAAGGVRLAGRAPPRSQVSLVSPETGATSVVADAGGLWTLSLVAAPQPRLFALMAQTGGRTLRGEGAVAVLPAPATAALLLRGGAGALEIGPATSEVSLAAVDFDGGGALSAAGSAPAGVEARLIVDGAPSGAGRADSHGRFSLLAVRAALSPGAHAVRIDTPRGAAEAAVITTGPPALSDQPYAARRITNGWRIDWTPPGGGVQSVIALDLPGSR